MSQILKISESYPEIFEFWLQVTVFKVNKGTNMNLQNKRHKSLNIIKNAPFKVKKSWFIGTIISRFKPCDFFLWGYMKELVYKPLPTSLLQLKEKTTLTLKSILEPMIQKAVYGILKKKGLKIC